MPNNICITNFPSGLGLVETNLVRCVVPGHIRKDDAIPLMKSTENLYLGHRSLTDLHLDPSGGLAVGVNAEEADGAVRVAECRAPHMEHVVELLDVDRAVDAEIGNRAGRERPIEGYVNGARSVQYGGINAGNVAGNDAVVGVDFGGLAELDVVGLGFGDLQGGLELIGDDDLGDGGAGGDMLTDGDGSGERGQHTGDAGRDLKSGFLILIEGELIPGLVDFGLLGGELNLDGVLLHLKLLETDLVLGGELGGGALCLIVGQSADDAQLVELLVGIGGEFGLAILGIDLGSGGLGAHEGVLERGLQVAVVGLGTLDGELSVEELLLEFGVGEDHDDRVRLDHGAGQDMDGNHGGIGLRRDEADAFLAGNQGAEAADLNDHVAALDGLGPDGAGVDGGDGRLEAHDAPGGATENGAGNTADDDMTAALLPANVRATDIHFGGSITETVSEKRGGRSRFAEKSQEAGFSTSLGNPARAPGLPLVRPPATATLNFESSTAVPVTGRKPPTYLTLDLLMYSCNHLK